MHIYQIIDGLPRLTILVANGAFRQRGPRLTMSRVKIIAESPHERQQSLVTVNHSTLSYFLHVILLP